MKVVVLINVWNDRHGTSGMEIGVYSDKGMARDAMKEDVRKYLADPGNPDTVPESETDDYCYVDVDGSGTNSEWTIDEKEVQSKVF